MMKNKITEEVILQRLEDKCIKDLNEIDTDEQLAAVLSHFEAEITHDFIEGQIQCYE